MILRFFIFLNLIREAKNLLTIKNSLTIKPILLFNLKSSNKNQCIVFPKLSKNINNFLMKYYIF